MTLSSGSCLKKTPFLQATFSFLSLKIPKNLRAARAIKIDWWVSGDWPMHYCLLMVSVTRAKKFKNPRKVRVFRIANGFRYGLTFWYRVCRSVRLKVRCRKIWWQSVGFGHCCCCCCGDAASVGTIVIVRCTNMISKSNSLVHAFTDLHVI